MSKGETGGKKFPLVIKKRGAVAAVVALMMCVAVYLNWSYGREMDEYAIGDGLDTSVTVPESDYADQDGVHVPSSVESGDGETEQADASDGDYFAAARLSRQQARDEAISILRQVGEDQDAGDETKKQTADDIAELAENAVKEARIENLVKAKGYEDCVVFINDAGINVIVPAPEGGITAEDAAKIKDIAVGETKLKSDKIKIVAAE